MKKNLHFLIFTACLLFSKNATSQLSYYYDNGEEATRSMLSTQKGSPNITQITYFSYKFVSERMNQFMKNEMGFNPIEDGKTQKKGEFEIITKRYLTDLPKDLPANKRTLEIEYTTAVIEGERIITEAVINAESEFITSFYVEFWSPEYDKNKVNRGDEYSNTEFLQDHVSANLKLIDTKAYKSKVWLEISNTEIRDFNKFKALLGKKIIRERDERNAILKRRATTTYTLKEKNPTSFAALQKDITSTITNYFSEHPTSVSTDLEISVAVDTSGKVNFSFNNVNGMNQELMDKISRTTVKPYMEKVFTMSTKDQLIYSIQARSETGTFLLKDDEIELKEGLTPESLPILTENKSRFNQGRGVYNVSTNTLMLNNAKTASVNVNSFKEKKSPKYYFVVGAVVVGIAAYYGYNTLKSKN